jgi:hypothetical protein
MKYLVEALIYVRQLPASIGSLLWLPESFSGNKGGWSLKLTIISLTEIRFKLYPLQAYRSSRCNLQYNQVKRIDICYMPVNKLVDLEQIRQGMLTRTLIKHLYDTSLQAIAQHS